MDQDKPKIPPIAWVVFALVDLVIVGVILWWFVFRGG